VKQMSVLTADAVELGRLMLDLSFVISSRVCISHWFMQCWLPLHTVNKPINTLQSGKIIK